MNMPLVIMQIGSTFVF